MLRFVPSLMAWQKTSEPALGQRIPCLAKDTDEVDNVPIFGYTA